MLPPVHDYSFPDSDLTVTSQKTSSLIAQPSIDDGVDELEGHYLAYFREETLRDLCSCY